MSFLELIAGAALAAGAAIWLVFPAGAAGKRLALMHRSGCGAEAAGAFVPGGPLPAVRLLLPGSVLLRRLRFARDRAAVERRRREGVIELCYTLAVELRTGRTPVDALRRAAEVLDPEPDAELAGVVAATRTGGDVAEALRRSGSCPGAAGLEQLGACWRVGSGAGAGFAPAVERLAGALRAEHHHRREVAAQLAGPHATMRLLAALPLLGLLMSTAMGLRPLGFLFGTGYGLACLVVGVGLDAAGLLWTHRLARSAEDNL